jgi:hypothetical protein
MSNQPPAGGDTARRFWTCAACPDASMRLSKPAKHPPICSCGAEMREASPRPVGATPLAPSEEGARLSSETRLTDAEVVARLQNEIDGLGSRLRNLVGESEARRHRIVALEAENARLREALASVVSKFGPRAHRYGCDCEGLDPKRETLTCADVARMARAALSGERKGG